MEARDKRQGGFTLIETAIAMIVMLVVGLAVASLFAYAVKYNSGADDRALARALAQQRLEQMRSRPYNHASLAATPTAGTAETVTHAGRSYRVVTFITNETTTMKLIRIEVRPIGGSGSWANAPVVVITRRTSTATGPYV